MLIPKETAKAAYPKKQVVTWMVSQLLCSAGTRGVIMSLPTQELEAAAASVVAVESQPDPPETVEEKPEEEKPEGESVEAEPVANAQLSQQDKPGLRYLAAFGDQGGVWFAQGLSWEEASAKYVESLKTENALLRQKLAASQAVSGEQEPISYSDRVPPKKQLPLVRVQGKRYDE